jgi:hypothetical protein
MTSRVARENCARLGTEDVELAKNLPGDAFSLLLRALRYARNARCGVWDFAVELAQLRQSGLSECDLRWLACKGYVEHGLETSQPAGIQRTFDDEPALRFTEHSSFVLTPLGIQLAKSLLPGVAAIGDQRVECPIAPQLANCGTGTPTWDHQRRELRIGRIVIKRFLVPAENQETILTVFQEEAWPAHIDDPLPPAPEIDPKRRLHSTIQCLNRNQQVRLVHFHGDGYGRGVRWELVSA